MQVPSVSFHYCLEQKKRKNSPQPHSLAEFESNQNTFYPRKELLDLIAKIPILKKLVRPTPTCFFGLNTFLDQKFGLNRIGPQGQKTDPIGSGWPQIGFKLGFNPIMYLINPKEPDLYPISGWVGPPGSKLELSRVGLARFIWSVLISK